LNNYRPQASIRHLLGLVARRTKQPIVGWLVPGTLLIVSHVGGTEANHRLAKMFNETIGERNGHMAALAQSRVGYVTARDINTGLSERSQLAY
jgi:hypothetical protein